MYILMHIYILDNTVLLVKLVMFLSALPTYFYLFSFVRRVELSSCIIFYTTVI